QHPPHLLILHFTIPPPHSPLIPTSKISQTFPHTKILILTIFHHQQYLFHVLKTPPKPYILKNSPHHQLIFPLPTVYQAETYVDVKFTTSLLNHFLNQSQTHQLSSSSHPFKILSKPHLQILPLIPKPYPNKHIPQNFFLSLKTLHPHKTHIITKLNLNTKPQLVEYALNKKLL
ncbi:LuxR C-terminal-related transcriptional regulator, partial [Staphylococcus epidermidis]|uniref:LuxR C-terminal-related transcriptional regulator n=1 Tax=Staphylococcus epidermidis TaxID=1282 RepID=UPI0011A1593A